MTGQGHARSLTSRRTVLRRIGVDALISLVVIVTSGVSNRAASGHLAFPSATDLISVSIGVVLALALLVRRRWPIPVLVFILLLWIFSAGIGHVSLSEELAAAVAIFQIARMGRRRQAIIGAAVSVVVLLAVLIAQNPINLGLILSGVAIIAFATAVGDAMHSRNALLESIIERAERAEQTREEEARRRVTEERLRIARELHDAAAHQIAVINLQAGAATAALAGDRRGDTERALDAVRSSARSVLSEIAALLVVLRNDEDPVDLNLPPVRGMADLAALVAGFEQSGLAVTGEHDYVPDRLSGAIDVVAFKVIQEALTNAHKHGSASTVDLEVAADSRSLRIRAANPVGAGVGERMPASGYGVTGMRERVASVRGDLSITESSTEYTLDVTLPLDSDERP